MTIVELMSRQREMLLRTCADRNDCSTDQELAILVAELFAILHPATLPMLDRMFEDIKQDAETDGELRLKRLAQIGIAATKIALREQEALDT